MKKNLKMQRKLLFSQTSFFFTLAAMAAVAVVFFIIHCISVFGRPITDVPNGYFFFLGSALSETAFYLFSILLPLAAALPFADSYFKERKDNLASVILIQTDRKKYYFSKMAAVFLSGFLVAFVPLMLSFLLNFLVFPITKGCDFTMFAAYDSTFFEKSGGWIDQIVLKDLFVSHPNLYNLVFLFIISLVGGMYAVIVYNLSFFVKKQHLLLVTSMFILSNVIALLSALVPKISFRLEDYCYAFSKIESFQPLVFFLMILFYASLVLVPIPLCIKKLRDVL